MVDVTEVTALDRSSIEGSAIPSSTTTQEAFEGLRRVKDNIPKRLWVVAAVGFWERAAFWGTTGPWQNYMQHPPAHAHGDIPGALGLGQAQATRIYCAFYIVYYVTPLFFALLSDNHLGRYKTLMLSLILYAIGCIVLTVSSVPLLAAKGWGMPGFVVALICIALGGGGFQTNISAFLAEQYTKTHPRVKTLKSGERVVTDHDLTLEYIYNLYFWVGNIGSLSMFVTVVLEKVAGFTWAYLLTTCFILISLLLLLLGRKCYVQTPLKGNLIPKVASILACASRNGFRMARADPIYQLENHHKTVSWTSHLVSELTRALGACRVLLAFIVFYVCFDQMQNNLISQSSQMETNGTPNDMVQTMNQIGCILFVPFTQHVMNPFLHRRNIYIQPITRIAIGFLFICVAMLYASLVQHAIYSTGPCYAHPNVCGGGTLGPNKLNVWIQAPTYLLIAAGEVFAVVTAIEYAYTNAPEDMKAIVQSINLIIAGMGSALGMALTPLAHDPNMTAFYGSLSGAMLVTAIVFWTLFRKSEDTSLPRIALKKASFSSSDKSNSTTSHVRHSNEGQTNDPELGIITDITQVMPPLTDPESGDSNHLESKETAAPEGLYSGL